MTKRSKRKLTLKLLEYATDAVNKTVDDKSWPQPEGSFSQASGELAKVLSSAVMDNTWDASSMEDWSWDPYSQCFRFDVHSVFRMGGDISSRPVQITSRFSFDPKKDLLEELDRVSEEIEQYSNNLLLMQRAYHEARKAGDASALGSDD